MTAFNGLASLQFLGTANNGQRISNTFHIDQASAGTAPDFAELLLVATQAAAQFDTTYRSLLTTDATFDAVVARMAGFPHAHDHGDQ